MKLNLHHKLFLAFIGWCAIGVYYSDYPIMSLQGFYPYRGEGLITYFIVTCIAFSYWKAFDSIRGLSWFCIISCLVMTIYYYANVPFYGHKLILYDVGRFESENFSILFLPSVALSAFACLAGILAMQIHPALSIVAFFPILNSGSRSAFIGLFIAWLTCFLLIRKDFNTKCPWQFTKFAKRGIITIFIILLAWVIFEKSYYFEQRFQNIPSISNMGHGPRTQWLLQGSRLSSMLPLTGYGLDTLSRYLTTPRMIGFEGVLAFTPDKTHSFVMDHILMTGWIGITLLLLSFGYAIAIAIKHPNRENIVCICTVLSFGLFGIMNPHGEMANVVALTAFVGIRKS